MEANDGSNDIVHPEVRAHINSLVSALGGFSADDDGRYKLGDDALEVLKDIKKWIRFYDEKTNRMDVARCLAEANLVGGDLLHILATWPENETDSKFKSRIALACFEIMAPLTWPIERDPQEMTINHHRHMPVLQLAQVAYKRAIINYDHARILHTAVRVALPSMALPANERSPRDHGVIKLVLFFLRNIAVIAPPPGVTYEGDESQISRSALIDAFSYQDIFLALLTIASNMGDEFRHEDSIVMEIIFHLVKRVRPSRLFLDEQQLNRAKADELTSLMAKEKAMLQAQKRAAPTRHNRFGTMVWIKREDGKMSAVSGQDALADSAARERKMDKSKTFRPPRRQKKGEMAPKDLGLPVSLNSRANDQLRGFVEEFLDSGFNPLFTQMRKSIDRDEPHVLQHHRAQFFYLVAWFLEAERFRRKAKASSKSKPATQEEVSSFNIVAGVLNQEMFISLSRALDKAYNDKDWPELTAVMRCFTQILLTVQEMSVAGAGNEDDEEIAENILNRLFYEESTHDAVANIARNYKDQGFEYLDACTELTSTYLRILEAYAKQNVDMQVRSRKRVRRKKKKAAAPEQNGGVDGDENPIGAVDESDEDDEAAAARTSSERKFDFNRFSFRFVPQGVVDTFVAFARYYRDLDDAQLKRAHRYFYRLAFKQDVSVMLFRVDIVHLFHSMVAGPEAVDRASPSFKEWEELVKQILRRMTKKIGERPALLIEMLFSKVSSTVHYLEWGVDKEPAVTTNPRPGAELEFKHEVDHAMEIAIAVGVLLDKSLQDQIDWVKSQLEKCENERSSWEAAEKAMPSVEGATAITDNGQTAPTEDESSKAYPPFPLKPDSAAIKTAMFKNPHLRLLMRLVGFARLAPSLDETPDSAWCIPVSLSADALKEELSLVRAAEFSPPTFDNDQSAEDQLRRKSASAAARKRRANFDDDDDAADIIDDGDEMLFPAGGPTVRKADAKKKLAARRRRRRKDDEDGGSGEDEEAAKERAKARKAKELEKAKRYKSAVYVDPLDDLTDDERDEAFFEREEEIRRNVGRVLAKVAVGEKAEGTAKTKEKGKKRKAVVVDDDKEGSASDSGSGSEGARKRHRSSPMSVESDSDASSTKDDDDDDNEDSRPKSSARQPKKKRAVFYDSSDDDDDEPSASASVAKDDEMQTETPLSSSPQLPDVSQPKAAVDAAGDVVMGENEDEDDAPVAKRRPRVKGGFVLDDSDDE